MIGAGNCKLDASDFTEFLVSIDEAKDVMILHVSHVIERDEAQFPCRVQL